MQKLIYRYELALLFCTLILSSKAQFSLQQTIEYTLENHPSVQVYTNNVAIADAQSNQALSQYLPQVSASVTALDNLKLQTTVLPAGAFGPNPTQVQLGTKYNTNATLDVQQTVFDASKIAAIKANKPYRELSLVQQAQHREELVYNTATAYMQVLIYKEQLDLLHANQCKYEDMVEVLQVQFEQGVVLEQDVDRIRVSLNTTNFQIEDAANKARLALNNLKNAMGMPLDEHLQIKNDIEYEKFAFQMVSDELEISSLNEIKMNELSMKLQEYNLKTKQATYLPSLKAVGKFGSQALDNDFENAWSEWNDYAYVGLSLQVPIFTGLHRSNIVQEEKLKLENEQLNLDLNRKNLQLRYDNAKASLNTAFNSYLSNKDNMKLALKLLDVTEYQYQMGTASLVDYLNDDSAYKSAESNYINSLYNWMISQLNYEKSKGNLMEFIQGIEQ